MSVEKFTPANAAVWFEIPVTDLAKVQGLLRRCSAE